KIIDLTINVGVAYCKESLGCFFLLGILNFTELKCVIICFAPGLCVALFIKRPVTISAQLDAEYSLLTVDQRPLLLLFDHGGDPRLLLLFALLFRRLSCFRGILGRQTQTNQNNDG